MADRTVGATPTLLGVSLKLYLDVPASTAWARSVARIAHEREAVRDGRVRLFVLPSLPALPAVIRELEGTAVEVGAQDLHSEDRGAFTGAISGADLAQVGCRYVEVGHAERRRLFGDDDEAVLRKLAAAVRNGLVPVLCVGESTECAIDDAAAECVRQIDSALGALGSGASAPELVVAYEPTWAIGSQRPASPDRVVAVTGRIRDRLSREPRVASARVIYGGSAQRGTLSELGPAVDGLFLGRFAHDTDDLARIIDEASALT